MIRFRGINGPFGFLSNFYPAGFAAGGVSWKSVEHFFQGMKSINPEEREKVRKAKTPALARKLGRKVTLRKEWNTLRVEVMTWALERKFRDPKLAASLLATGSKKLVEDAPWDNFWGCGKEGKGKNVLGKLLMELRSKLVTK